MLAFEEFGEDVFGLVESEGCRVRRGSCLPLFWNSVSAISHERCGRQVPPAALTASVRAKAMLFCASKSVVLVGEPDFARASVPRGAAGTVARSSSRTTCAASRDVVSHWTLVASVWLASFSSGFDQRLQALVEIGCCGRVCLENSRSERRRDLLGRRPRRRRWHRLDVDALVPLDRAEAHRALRPPSLVAARERSPERADGPGSAEMDGGRRRLFLSRVPVVFEADALVIDRHTGDALRRDRLTTRHAPSSTATASARGPEPYLW